MRSTLRELGTWVGCSRLGGSLRLQHFDSTKRGNVGQNKSILFKSADRDKKSDVSVSGVALSGLPAMEKPFLVLGIETSCDDTGVAVVRSDGEILSNVVISQQHIHEHHGGVVPMLAKAEHMNNIDAAVARALSDASVTMNDIGGVGVTQGPGLEICLRVGVRKAQEICKEYRKPMSLINHLEAHCLSARLAGLPYRASSDTNCATVDLHSDRRLPFPFLAVLVSGGHTSVVLCNGVSDYTIIGGTLDDAIGECFDKVARMLGITSGSNGGALIEKLAATGNKKAYPFPVPMMKKLNCDFSFSGLKTSFKNCLNKLGDPKTLSPEVVSDLCASFQQTAFEHVKQRLGYALTYTKREKIPIRAVVAVGGVACSNELKRVLNDVIADRARMLDSLSVASLLSPPPVLCTDNGVMVAWAAVEKFLTNSSDEIENQDVYPRWPLGKLIPHYGTQLEALIKKEKRKQPFIRVTRKSSTERNFRKV